MRSRLFVAGFMNLVPGMQSTNWHPVPGKGDLDLTTCLARKLPLPWQLLSVSASLRQDIKPSLASMRAAQSSSKTQIGIAASDKNDRSTCHRGSQAGPMSMESLKPLLLTTPFDPGLPLLRRYIEIGFIFTLSVSDLPFRFMADLSAAYLLVV